VKLNNINDQKVPMTARSDHWDKINIKIKKCAKS
jgi:hypothetical protein